MTFHLTFFQGEDNLKTSICTFLAVLSHWDIITQNLTEKVSLNCKKSLNLTIKIELLRFVLIFVSVTFPVSSAISPSESSWLQARWAGYSVPYCWVLALTIKLARGTNRTLSYFNAHTCWRVGSTAGSRDMPLGILYQRVHLSREEGGSPEPVWDAVMRGLPCRGHPAAVGGH